jgi:hypothetical protein
MRRFSTLILALGLGLFGCDDGDESGGAGAGGSGAAPEGGVTGGAPAGGEPAGGEPSAGAPEAGAPEAGAVGTGGEPGDAECGVSRAAEGTDCEIQCGWVADCAVCADKCPGYPEPARRAVFDGCVEICQATPALSTVVATHGTCDDSLNFVKGQSAQFAQGCDGAEPPVGGGPAGGEPAGGEPAGGEPAGGEPAGGEPAGGEPAGGEPAGGEPAGGEPAGGEPAGGEPAGGEPAGGEPAGGEPAGGEPAGGEPAGGEPAGGEPAGGEPAGGEPAGGEPAGGEPAGGEPAGGEPAGGQPDVEPNPACPDLVPDERGGCPATIHEIKDAQTYAPDALVTIHGTVTAIRGSGDQVSHVAVQAPDAEVQAEGIANAGVWVDATNSGEPFGALRRGDRVRLTARIHATLGRRALNRIVRLETDGNGAAPAPTAVAAADIATDGDQAAELEGVLVEVADLSVTDITPLPANDEVQPTNEFVLGDALRVDDYLHLIRPAPAQGSTFVRVAGVLVMDHGNSKLAPRDDDDVERGPARLIDVSPFLSEIVLGAPGVPAAFGTPLTVTLDRFVGPEGLDLQLESGDPEVLEVAPVLHIDAGNSTAVIPVTPLALTEGVALTVRSGDQVFEVAVAIVEPQAGINQLIVRAPPLVRTFSSFDLIIEVDTPAPDLGWMTQVEIISDVEFALFGDPGPTIQPGELSVSANFNAGGDPAEVRIVVTVPQFPELRAEATVNIVNELPPPPMVINEVDYRQPAGNADFVELYNPTDAPASLANARLEFIDGNVLETYLTVELGGVADALPAGGYLVVGRQAALANLPDGTLRLVLDEDIAEEGFSGYGVRLVGGDGFALDGMSYDGFLFGVTESSQPLDGDAGADISLGRCPNGADTDDNGVDFGTGAPSPGAPNTCGE